jgi:hypothetical protein
VLVSQGHKTSGPQDTGPQDKRAKVKSALAGKETHLLLLEYVRLLPYSCGNPLYVIQRCGTTAISVGDIHNDLHRYGGKVCSPQRNPCIVCVFLPGVLTYFSTCSILNRHRTEIVVTYFSPFINRPAVGLARCVSAPQGKGVCGPLLFVSLVA